MHQFQQNLLLWFGESGDKQKSTNLVKVIGLLIVFSIGLAIVATEPIVQNGYGEILVKLDIIVAAIFLVEYLARLWVAP